MARKSEVERAARAVCVELAGVAGGRPLQWRTVDSPVAGAAVADSAGDAAIAHAVKQDWLLTERRPPHSICLTDAGQTLAAQRLA